MDFTEHIITYYSTESRHGFTAGLASGIMLIILAILFRWFANPLSILKGLATVLFVGGLIFSIGGYYAGITAQKSLSKKIQLYQADKREFLEKEVAKVEGIHNSWTRIKIFWSAFIVLGLILIFTTTKPFWMGIAIGSLIVGTIGHIEETVSFQHNERYRKEINAEEQEQRKISF